MHFLIDNFTKNFDKKLLENNNLKKLHKNVLKNKNYITHQLNKIQQNEQNQKKFEEIENYSDFLKKNFNINKYEQDILNRNNIDDDDEEEEEEEKNKKIGEFENIDNLIYKCNFNQDYEIINFLLKNQFWRNSLQDGNSFYRTFMFKLIENYINFNKIDKIKEIIYDINEEKFENIFNINNIKIDEINLIFNKIIFYMEEYNNLEKANSILLNSFNNKNNNFDHCLILYLKQILKSNLENLFKNDKNYLNLNLLDKLNIEPDNIIIFIIPYLFDINLNIIYIEQDSKNPKKGNINLSNDNLNDFPTINLLNLYNGYYPIYKNKNDNNIETLKEIENENEKIIPIVYEINNNEEYFCEICLKDKVDLIVLPQKKAIFCKECLIKDMQKKLNERSEDYVNNAQFNSLENYLRPIKINNKIYIDNFEYNKINNSNLIDDFIELINNNNNLNDDENENEENKNENENEENKNEEIEQKNEEENKKNEEFNFDNVEFNNNVNDFDNNINNDNNNNKEALKSKNKDKKKEENKKKLLKNNCCDCLKSNKNNKDLKMYEIKIKNNDFDVDHLLCENCIKKYRKELKKIKINDDDEEKKSNKNNNNNEINNENNNENNVNNEKCINCNICKKKHELKDSSYEKLIKSGDDCCCIIF